MHSTHIVSVTSATPNRTEMVMSYEVRIETGVPIPPPSGGPGGRFDPNSVAGKLRALAVGDSLFIPGIKPANASGFASGTRKRTGFTFTTRKVTVDGVDGVRIWRTA